ncbi:hypothetical protein AAFN85_08110 [Mucilaginibacter sp. CAU 1740]|uniref:hypothetical protein n=1 Tax=Mucilaginibacter sp. CAU 1740 TaxID=3140365 RepID=UPI00325AC45D
MKKVLLMCAAALVIFGCGSKSNNPTPTNKPDYKSLIIGKWVNEKDTIYEYTNNKLTHTTVVKIIANTYVEYKADGTGADHWTYLIPFTYTITDKTVSYKIPPIHDNGSTYPASEYSEEIKMLNGTQFVTRYENVDTDQQGNVYKEVEMDYYTKLTN